ncbi:MAG TPA: ribosome small subunit-dependent GTPase A [Bacteroidales bacterium]|nr:ribosome small subunit-dependent GTPase A [Bacteroidales bacterium]
MILEQFGWNDFFNNHYIKNTDPAFKPARVVSLKGFKYHLATEKGELPAELSGKLMYASAPDEMPRVGDWVYYLDYETQGYIMEVFPRLNSLYRKSPGNRSEIQVLAANVDYALIVQGLDRDFNLMRLDRYIVQVTGCGIKPVIVLNKEDLVEDREVYRHEVARLQRDYPVIFCSTINRSEFERSFKPVLQPGKTHIMIGSSGVGKSSIINTLLDEVFLSTREISDSTAKGKHTTTTRDLFMLPDGSMIIDTPGMREFGIALEDEITSSGMFPAIDALAVNCRYADCRHQNESGCAVLEAFQNGTLDAKIYNSYEKLLKEQQHFEIKIEDKKRLGKQFGKMIREAKEYRNKYKY